MSQKSIYWYYLGIFLAAFLAMLPLTLLWHPLKYDMIDQYYPWRYFIGECLQNGHLPLWNPYQVLGYPIHADPQSSAWYPVTWFFGYFFGYDIYIISYDFLLHIFLAGMGMFYLGKQLHFRNETAFMMSLAYMLSGFFIGNAQHMTWMISGAWIPFIVGAFIALREHASLAGAVRIALPLFMILAGGYPGFFFVLIYLLLAILIFFIIDYLVKKDYASLRRYIGYNLLTVILTVFMATVVLVSLYHLRDAMTRGEGIPLHKALFGAFTLPSLVSFILPFAVIRDMDFYNTDLSMSNGYFGLIPLAFLILAITLKKPGIINLFLVWGAFCLMAGVGDALPVREFLYHYLPFMDQFRFPALFRVYIILSFVVVAGFGFDSWINGTGSCSRRIKIVISALGLVILGFGIYQLFRGNLKFTDFLMHEAFVFSDKSTISQHIFFQSAIQVILLSVLLTVISLKRLVRRMPLIVLLLVFFDLAMATRLNGPYTLYSDLYKSKDIYMHSTMFPDGFPLPGQERIINNKDQGKLVYKTFWRNLNIFHKQISYQGYNPMQLKGYVELADNHPVLFETILNNPLVYFSDRAAPLDSLSLQEQAKDFASSRVYLDEADYMMVRETKLRKSPGDTAFITGFSPNEVGIECRNAEPVLMNVLQMNYHGWKAEVDGKPARILHGNLSLLSIVLPAGQHEVVFFYHPVDVITGFYISLLMLAGGVIIFGMSLWKAKW